MPFTPSHAVVALPFIRTPLVPAAIAVGAMTPDLPLFVRVLPLDYATTHSFARLPLTMAVALALLLLWRCILRPAARELAPGWVARRLPDEWDAGALTAIRQTFGLERPVADRAQARPAWRVVLLLIVSLALGVASHIVWDLFTHEGRWGSKVFPALSENWGPLPGFKWLQHGSSAIGLLVIVIWIVLWLARRTEQPDGSRLVPSWVRWSWWVSLPAVLLVAWGWGLATLGPLTEQLTAAHIAYRVLLPACAWWACGTVVLCIAVQLTRSRPRGRSSA